MDDAEKNGLEIFEMGWKELAIRNIWLNDRGNMFCLATETPMLCWFKSCRELAVDDMVFMGQIHFKIDLPDISRRSFP